MSTHSFVCQSCWRTLDMTSYPSRDAINADHQRARWFERAQSECRRWLSMRDAAAIALAAAREGRSVSPGDALAFAIAEQGTLIDKAISIAAALYGVPFAHTGAPKRESCP